MEWFHDTTLKIPNVQKSNKGSYWCVVNNCAGSQISKAAKLSIGTTPDINSILLVVVVVVVVVVGS